MLEVILLGALFALVLSESGGNGGGVVTEGGNRVVLAADQAINSGLSGADCWDWVFQVYNLAGYAVGQRSNLADLVVLFRGQQYDSSSPYKFLPESRLAELQPGDWLYVHNQNTIDRAGNHSDIFIRWKTTPYDGIAVTASSPGAGMGGLYRERNLITNPIAWWMRVRA